MAHHHFIAKWLLPAGLGFLRRHLEYLAGVPVLLRAAPPTSLILQHRNIGRNRAVLRMRSAIRNAAFLFLHLVVTFIFQLIQLS